MKKLIELQKQLFPDLLEMMQQRYRTLHSVELFQPIGRRALSENTGLTERTVRGEMEFLQSHGLISVSSKGMYITEEGKILLDQLSEFMREVMGLTVLENELKDRLGADQVIVVPGNSDMQDWIKREMGKVCVKLLKATATVKQTIAVTGGTTMAAVAQTMTPMEKNCLFVPARGGLGEKMENQANTIASEMAKKANGEYRLLYVPDPLSESSYQTMMQEPSIKEILQVIMGANIIVHGIGDALAMAERRKTPDHVIDRLKQEEAASEAFGYYFDKQGNVVEKVRTIGLHLDDLENADCVIAVAGGESKAEAIMSYFQQKKSNILITDEAAAKQIIK